MQFSLTTDESGHFICDLADEAAHTTITASNVPEAGDDLLGAIEDARNEGFGESLWYEPQGMFRWMLRRAGDRLTVAVMWCENPVVGYQHAFRGECAFAWFDETVREAVGRLRAVES